MLNDWKLDTGHLVRAVVAQRFFILIVTAVFTALGIGFVATREDEFSAQAMLLVEDQALNINVTDNEELLQREGGLTVENLLNHVELIKGTDVVRRAFDSLKQKGILIYEPSKDSGPGVLASVASAIPNPLAGAGNGVELAEEEDDGLGRRLPSELISYARSLEVEGLGRSRLIQVSFKHKDPALAAAGANALADAYIELLREEQAEVGSDAREWMMEQAANLRQQASQADQAVERFRRDSGLLQSDGTRLIEQKITNTNTQLTDAELESLALNSKVDAIERALQSGNPFAVSEVADAESVVGLRNQIITFESEIADLRATYGPNHPLLLAKQEQSTLAQRSLNNEITNIVNSFKNQSRAADQRVEALTKVLQDQEGSLADANLRGVELSELEKEAAIGNQVLEGFLGRLQEVVAGEDVRVQPLDIRVVTRADVPNEPSGPARVLLSVVFMIGGFLASSSVAMFREVSRRVVREPDDLKAVAPDLSVWVIPRREGKHTRQMSNLHQLISSSPYAHFSASVRNAYRQTIATLPDNEQIVMLTSAQPGDGKTTMSLCFAEVVANTGRSVVLVDTDFRRAKIHIHTGLGRVAGLSDWLEGTEPLRCKRPQGSEFYTITAGSTELAQPDRWNSQTIQELLETLRGRFETIILDTPPVAALADPYLVAAESSMVLFVTRWQHTKLNYVKDLVGPLRQRTDRLELILTDVDLKGAASQGFSSPMEYYKDTAQYYTD